MKLIQTKEYLYLIDEKANIGKGYLFYDYASGEIGDVAWTTVNKALIIAYYPLTKDSKELDLPLLPNPFKEENILELGEKDYQIFKNLNGDHYHTNSYLNGFKRGYKVAQSKQFSLEDMEAAVAFGIQLEKHKDDQGKLSNDDEFDGFIQSLSTQQLPKEFEPDILYRLYDGTILREEIYSSLETELKVPFRKYFETNNNSEGKEVIQGTYKY